MNTTEVRTIKTKASVFIIPNYASLAEDLIGSSNRVKEQLELAELNGFEYDESKDHFIQVWIHADDVIKSENLNCHGAVYVDEDGQKYRIDCSCGFISEGVLQGHKEGDVINYKVPATMSKYKSDPDDYEEIILDMDLTLDQLHYRYKNFGAFENVLDYVMRYS